MEEFILKIVWKKVNVSYKLQPLLIKHDEIFEDTWETRENEWLPYVKNVVLSTAFCHARYTRGMENYLILV